MISSGYLYIRPDNHQGYKDAVTGFSKNLPDYPFPVWDPDRIITDAAGISTSTWRATL